MAANEGENQLRGVFLYSIRANIYCICEINVYVRAEECTETIFRSMHTHTQTATHNQSKNSVWTRGSQLTLDREEEEEEESERDEGKGRRSKFLGLLAHFLNKHAQKSGSVFITAHERGCCVHVNVSVRVRAR